MVSQDNDILRKKYADAKAMSQYRQERAKQYAKEKSVGKNASSAAVANWVALSFCSCIFAFRSKFWPFLRKNEQEFTKNQK